MSNTELLIRLRELHGELSSLNTDIDAAKQIDEETIDALGQLVTDVGGLVDHAKGLTDANKDADHDVIMERISNFESNHPRVTQFLSQMTDLLAMIGI